MRSVHTLSLVFLSGLAALGHQTVWVRLTVDVLGADTNTFARVTGSFFLGLAGGAFWASRKQPPAGGRWRWLAAAETGTALLALPILVVAGKASLLYGLPGLADLFKWLLPMLLVTPPAMMMGLVLPWLFHALQNERALTPRRAVSLYAVNTLGGMAGIPMVLLVFLPQWGSAATAFVLVLTNLIVAGGFLWLGRSQTCFGKNLVPSPAPLPDRAPNVGRLPREFATLSFGSGFLVLAMEVMFQLQLQQISINSLFSSGGVLFVVLLALGLSPFFITALLRIVQSPANALALACFLGMVVCSIQPALKMAWAGGLNIIPYELSPVPYALTMFRTALQSIAVPMLVAGLVFPLLLHRLTTEGGGHAPGLTGELFMWNGLGGWIGAEVASRWLAPTFGLWLGMGAIATGYFALLTLLNLSRASVASRQFWKLASMAGVFVLFYATITSSRFPNVGVDEGGRIVDVEVGREGVVAVLDRNPADQRIVMNNTYTLGGSTAMFNQERQAHLPLLLHGHARTVATLGVATGSTTGGVILHPTIEHVDAIELSPLVAKFARRHFSEFNRNVFEDPRVKLIEDDARWIIANRPGAYDVVIGDLFMPWKTGTGRLFTLEHFQNVRRSLKPGGLYCQWLPMFQLTRPQYESILHTFRTVFPDVVLLRGDFYAELPIIGLLGGVDVRDIDWLEVGEACDELRLEGKITDPLMRHAEGVAMMLVGHPPSMPGAALNTLANGWLEFDAGRNIIGLREPWHVGVPLATLIRDTQRANRNALPVHLQPAQESGQFFLTLEVAATIRSPELHRMEKQISLQLPEPIRNDTGANRLHWPAKFKPF